ncbi:MAG: hypothetical protein MUO60_07690 [Clostridiaceae bacterium]|nr:hypothetical protein [Clostridiaceae bacterium]
MWSDKNLLDIIKMFLPSTSKIILFKTPYKRPAVELIDLDGDNILELVGAYYWYYLADAQIKTGNTKDACQSIDKALTFEYPYPSSEKLMQLKKQICEDKTFNPF